MNTYEVGAHFYDLTIPLREKYEDIEFYKDFLGQPPKDVLEIGCGTGRVSIELAKTGFTVHGLDLSSSMLEVFKEKLTHLSPEVRSKIQISQADMCDFKLEKEFDLAIFPFRVFQALSTNKERLLCLASVKRSLKPSGSIIIDMFNPNPAILDTFGTRIERSHPHHLLNGQFVERITRGQGHDACAQTLSFNYEYLIKNEKGELISKREENFTLGYLYKHQALKIFIQAGFKLDHLYGYWDKREVNDDEKKELIFVLKK